MAKTENETGESTDVHYFGEKTIERFSMDLGVYASEKGAVEVRKRWFRFCCMRETGLHGLWPLLLSFPRPFFLATC